MIEGFGARTHGKQPMKKVLLITPPYDALERGGRMASIAADLPSLGLLYIAAFLRSNGHEVHLYDAQAQKGTAKQILQIIKATRFDVVGISSTTPSITRAGAIAHLIKDNCPDVTVLIGGAHTSAVPEETLACYSAIDAAVVGEGEITLMELLDKWPEKSWQEVRGIVSRSEDGYCRGGGRPLIEDLDVLPFPAWDLLTGFPGKFHPASFKTRRLPATHLLTSRGCPYNCIFCDSSVFTRKVRFHSVDYVLEMLELLTGKYGIREISVEDDTFTLNLERSIDICTRILEKGLNLSWSCNARIKKMDPQILSLFKRAGCWQMAFGIESGSQEILDFAGKGTSIEQIRETVNMVSRTGISSRAFFIFGFPKETETSLRQTIDFAKSLPLDNISLTFMTPFPGSKISAIASQYGTFEDNWSKMTILESVFVPFGLTEQLLREYYNRFIREFYFRRRIIFAYIRLCVNNPLTGIKIVWAGLRLVVGLIKGGNP